MDHQKNSENQIYFWKLFCLRQNTLVESLLILELKRYLQESRISNYNTFYCMAESQENKNIMKDDQEKLYDINEFQQEQKVLKNSQENDKIEKAQKYQEGQEENIQTEKNLKINEKEENIHDIEKNKQERIPMVKIEEMEEKKEKNPQDQILNKLQKILEKFPLDKEEKKQIVELFRNGDIESCKEYVKKKQKQKFFSELSELKTQVQKKEEKKEKNPQDQMLNKLQKILEKFPLDKEEKKQIVELFRNGDIESCKEYVKKKQKQKFFSELSELKTQVQKKEEKKEKISQDQTLLTSPRLLDNDKWMEQLRKIFQQYGIQSDEQVQFKTNFCAQKLQKCLFFVHKNVRHRLKEDLERVFQMFQEVKQNKSWQQALSLITQQYQISKSDIQPFKQYFFEGQIASCCQYIPKKKKKKLQQELNFLYLDFLISKNSCSQWKLKWSKLLDKLQEKQRQQLIEDIIEGYPKNFRIRQPLKNEAQQIANQFIQIKKRVYLQIFQKKLYTYLESGNPGGKNTKGVVQSIISGNFKPDTLSNQIQIPEFQEFIIKHDKFNFTKLKKEVIKLVIQYQDEQKEYCSIELSDQAIRKFFSQEYPQFNFITCSFKLLKKQIQSFDELFSLINDKIEVFLTIQKKNELNYIYGEEIFPLYISKKSKLQEQDIICMITKDLSKNKSFDIKSSDVILNFFFQNKTTKTISSLKDAQIQYGSLIKIIVDLKIKVRVYFNGEQKIIMMQTCQKVYDLKIQLEKDLIPKEAQNLSSLLEDKSSPLIQKNEGEQLLKFLNRNLVAEFILKDFHTVEYYGFHKNNYLTHEIFSEFFLEDEEKNIQIINNSDFEQKELEGLFFDNFMKHLFSSIKKRFPILSVINKFKEMVAKVKYKNIWSPHEEGSPIKMNQHFLLMYILHNSDKKLKIQLMNLVKNKIPLPLYLSKFSSIFNLENEIIFNQEIIWCYKKGINIVSVGLHNQNSLKETGKSSLMNYLFFTNFPLKGAKHNIIKKVPYISISVFDDLFPLNIIDVPSDCGEQQKENLLKVADIIFIHSWKSESETKNFIKQLSDQYQVPTISFIRDTKDIIKQQLQIIKTTKIIEGQPLKVINLTNFQLYKSTVDLLREKVNSVLRRSKIKKGIDTLITQENQIIQFSELLRVFQKQYEHICFFIQKKQEKVEKSGKKLHRNIQSTIQFIAQSKINKGILLNFFLNKIRLIQKEVISHYMQIYKLKQMFQALSEPKNQQKISEINKELKKIKNPSINSRTILHQNEEQVLKVFEQITSQFENHIKPHIFSSQLFWRELIAYNKYDKSAKIQQYLIYDLVVQLKSVEIMNNQPFQIIDGDNLQMNKVLMKDVFKCLNERCLVLSIIGPQSSGKSTLLNFLFGCDFATSEGRCTRGVYGTFFRFNDQFMGNFDGIFVIDTEGLFAVTNQKDAQHLDRQDFDSKLVLFCLAVSDFVIINVKGNIDNHTEKILRICYEKLQSLNLSEDSRPQIVIVLNQNNTSRTQQSQNQFKKIKKTLDFKIQRSLPLAYKIDNYTHQQISILAENQILSKKHPEIHFLKETSKLLQNIIQRMKFKKNAEKIIDKIDKFYEIWSTVLTFPNLSQLTTKQYLQQELRIKQWKKNKQEQLSAQIHKLLLKVKSEQMNEKFAIKKLEQLSILYLNDFIQSYKKQNLPKDIRILVENEEKQIHLKNQNSQIKMRYYLMEISLKKQMNREKFEGECFLREKQRQIIKNQNEKIKNYTQQQKISIFNECFQESLKKLQNTVKLNEKQSRQYERIQGDYNFLLKTSKSSMKGLCLPKQTLQVSQKTIMSLTIQETMYITLKEIVYKKLSEDASHFMSFVDEKYTNVLKGSLSDAKLKYFDTRKYFAKEKKTHYFYVSRQNLSQCIQFDELFDNTSRQVLKKNKSPYEVNYLKNIYQQINTALKCFELKLYSFNDLLSVYESVKSSYIPKRWYSSWSDTILFIQKIEKPRKMQNIQLFPTVNSQIQTKRRQEQFKHDNSRGQFDYLPCTKKIINRYIQIERESIYKYDNGKEELHDWHFISKKITGSIKWSVIQQEMKQISNEQKNGRLLLASFLQQDLLKLNLSVSIPEQQVRQKQSHKNKKNSQKKHQRLKFLISKNISTDNQQLYFDSFQVFFKQLGYLKYINTRKLKEKIKSFTDPHSYQNHIFIGKQEVIYIKETKPEFRGYLDNDYRSINQRFRKESFRVFAFQQIKRNQGLQLFFGTIFNMAKEVKQKWGSFESKAITQLYNKVNEEISLFNNDLNQISHKLNVIFIGKVHKLITYLIWKYQIDSLKEKQNQPLKNKIKSRQHQLKKFLDRTSNNLDKIVDQQVQSFHQALVKAFEQIIKEEKKIYMHKQKVEFSYANTRENIQNELDVQIFSRRTEKDMILQYLQKPVEAIEEKYQQKYEKAWDHMSKKFQSNKIYEKLYQDLNSSIQSLVQFLQNQKISEENGSPNDLFQIIGIANNLDYDEEAKVTLFQYFLDLLRDDEPSKKRQCSDVLLEPKIQLKNAKKLSEFSEKVLQKVNPALLKITNLNKFLKKNLVQVNQKQLKKFLVRSFQFKDEEKKQFINSIRVVICKETCPCCARICGVEDSHTFHKCIYGHQMRALAGNFIKKSDGQKQAFVARCEQLGETDIMQFNGNKMTWTQFKNYWSQKPTGGWLYDDAKDNFYPQNKKRFEEAWAIAGPIFCQEKGIQYVPFNEAQNQIQSFNQKAHFIFALDDSGSMSGGSWNDLMKAVGETINKIKQYEKSGSEVKVSVLNFSSNTHLYYERYSPNQINISSIHYRDGGTEFQKPFELAYNIAQKTIHQEAIVFIFMTDGGANYPQRGIQKFKQLSSRYPKSFIYSGIQFGSGSSVMKNISSALNGKNIVASNFEQLLQAYMSCVEIIAFQEENEQKVMECDA